MTMIKWLVPAVAMATAGGCVMTEASETRSFNHTGFDSIDASGGVNLVLKQGPFSINAEGPKSKLEKLVIEQEGTTLNVRRENMSWSWFNVQGRDVVTITAPSFTHVELSGGVDIDADGLNQPALSIKASGGADFNAKRITIGVLSVDNSGGADVNLSGACKSLTVDGSGGADFSSRDLTCEAATVTASGGADADVTVTADANGKASSGGDIRFYGSPATFSKDASSGGDVELVAP